MKERSVKGNPHERHDGANKSDAPKNFGIELKHVYVKVIQGLGEVWSCRNEDDQGDWPLDFFIGKKILDPLDGLLEGNLCLIE